MSDSLSVPDLLAVNSDGSSVFSQSTILSSHYDGQALPSDLGAAPVPVEALFLNDCMQVIVDWEIATRTFQSLKIFTIRYL